MEPRLKSTRKRLDHRAAFLALGVTLTLLASAGVRILPDEPNRTDFTGIMCVDLEGNSRPCAQLPGIRAVLVFSVFCADCRDLISEIPRSEKLVGISAHSLPYLRYYRIKLGIRWPIVRVEKPVLREIGVTRLPTLIRLDASGKIVSRLTGKANILSAIRLLQEDQR